MAAGPAVFAAQLDPLGYIRRPHLDVISEAWRDIHAGTTNRLAVSLPSQTGKTTTAVDWAVFWWLVLHPTARIAIASYGDSLATTRGRAIRRLITSHGEGYGLVLDPATRAAHDWSLTTGGGVLSVGVGSGFTGRACDCLAGGTNIITRDGTLPIEEFVQRGAHGEVLSYSHQTGHAQFRRVLAARTIPRRSLVEVITARGRRLRCTPDHRIYVVGRGYVPAAALQAGDRLRDVRGELPQTPVAGRPVLLSGLCDGPGLDHRGLLRLWERVQASAVRGRKGPEEWMGEALLLPDLSGRGEPGGAAVPVLRPTHAERLRQGVLLSGMSACRVPRTPDVSSLWSGVHQAPVRGGEGEPPGTDGHVVLPRLLRRVGRHEYGGLLPGLRRGDPAGARPLLLLGPMPPQGQASEPAMERQDGGQGVPDVPVHLPAEEQPSRPLLSPLRRQGPRGTHEGPGELALQARPESCQAVPPNASDDSGARRLLRGVWPRRADGQLRLPREAVPAEQPHCPSSRRGSGQQPPSQPDHLVPAVSHGPPQVGYDTVSVVRRVRGGGHTVYDLQVEGNSNLFADDLLVHNCAIIDDPHKDRVEADSAAVRRHVHDWWSSVVVPRMAPGAPIVVVATRWHPGDLIGMVTAHEGTTDRGGRWRVISMPALCTDPKADPLGRQLGDPLPHPRITEGDTEALLRHWHERRASMTPRDWLSICQCDPKPPGGTLLTGDELREARYLDPADHADSRRVGVAVDPSGGGRDTAGVVGGYLGDDGRLWYTHDRSGVMPADKWARAACQLAADTDADVIVYEANYGGDMAKTVIRTAWDALQREGLIPPDRMCPRIVGVHSRRGKLLRAEPVAQAFREDRARTAAYLPEMEAEWVEWTPTSPDSPGRIDASVHLAWELLPPPGSAVRVAAPVGQMPVTGLGPLS